MTFLTKKFTSINDDPVKIKKEIMKLDLYDTLKEAKLKHSGHRSLTTIWSCVAGTKRIHLCCPKGEGWDDCLLFDNPNQICPYSTYFLGGDSNWTQGVNNGANI